MRDYKIKYRTFDQLLDSVMDEFSTYDKNSLIEPSHLVKIAKKINKQLMHRITKTKACTLEFENYVAKLPDDFLTPNYVLYIKPYTKVVPQISGVQKENISIPAEELDAYNEVYITDAGDAYDVVEKKNYIEYRFRIVSPVTLKDTPSMVNTEGIKADIKGEYLKLNVSSGYLYFNYEGMLEDEEGNLLVLDHDLVNDYYEYAFKRRIIENLIFNGEEATMGNKLALVESRYKESRKEALSVANMFDFSEIEETINMNRQAQFKRYYSIFI